MAGYNDTKQKIIDTLAGRPAGVEIQPEDHQEFALDMLEYIRSVELTTSSSLIGIAEEYTVPVQPSSSKVSYIAGISQNKTRIFTHFRGIDGLPITVTTGDMEGFLIVFIWNTEYWSVSIFPTNIITSAEVANYYIGYTVKKTYASTAALNADVENPIGIDGRLIRLGDVVTVINPLDASENAFYSRIDGAWQFQMQMPSPPEQTEGFGTGVTMSQLAIGAQVRDSFNRLFDYLLVSENLINSKSIIDGKALSDVNGEFIQKDPTWNGSCVSSYIDVKEGSTYKLYSIPSNAWLYSYHFYDAQCGWISKGVDNIITTGAVVPNGAKYIRICWAKTSGSGWNVNIVKNSFILRGSTLAAPTVFKPYNSFTFQGGALGKSKFSELEDVSNLTPTENQVWGFDGTKWFNRTLMAAHILDLQSSFSTFLGAPAQDGYLLSSLANGTRSWVAPYSHPDYANNESSDGFLGHIKASKLSAIDRLLSLFERKGTGTELDPYVIEAKYDFYSIGGSSAYGLGVLGGGGGGGYDRLDEWEAYDSSKAGWVLSAALGYGLHQSINSIITSGLATQTWVTAQINALIGGAPGVLDTINEIATALGNDPNFVTTMTNLINGKEASLGVPAFDDYILSSKANGVRSWVAPYSHPDYSIENGIGGTIGHIKASERTAWNEHKDSTDKHFSPTERTYFNKLMEFLKFNIDYTSLFTTLNFYSEFGVSTYGIGSGGGGGSNYDRLDEWASYDISKAGWVLSAGLGYELKVSVDGKASSSHSHSWTAITDKPTAFNPLAHSHAISEVAELSTALSGKESGLGNPSSEGQILSSTLSGVRSWVNRYVLPVAAAAVLGGVMIGSNISVNAQGLISVAAPYSHPDYSIETGIGGTIGHIKASERTAWNNHISNTSSHLSTDERTFFNKLKDYLKIAADNTSMYSTINFYSESGVSAFGIGSGGGGGGANVLDTLTSTSTIEALSANMGRELNVTKQPLLNGTGFIKASGTTISYDNDVYLAVSATSSNPINGNFAIGSYNSRNFIQSHNGQPLDINPLGNTVTINGYTAYHSGNFIPSNYAFLNGSSAQNFSANRLTLNENLYFDGNTNKTIRMYSASAWYYTLNTSGDDFVISDAGGYDFIKLFYNGGTKYTKIGNVLIAGGAITMSGELTGATGVDVIGKGIFGTATTARASYSNGLSLKNIGNTATSLFLWQEGVGSGHFGFRANDSTLYITNSYTDGLVGGAASIALSNTGEAIFSSTVSSTGFISGGEVLINTNNARLRLQRIGVNYLDFNNGYNLIFRSIAANDSGAINALTLTPQGDAVFSSVVYATSVIENGTALASKYLALVGGSLSGGLNFTNASDLSWQGGWSAGKPVIVSNANGLQIFPKGNTQTGELYLNGYTVYHSGNLTNTLTNGYLPYWNGSSLVDSVLYTVSSNVGLGGHPTQKLAVFGNQVFTNASAEGNLNYVIAEISAQARSYANQGARMASIQFKTNASAWYKGDISFMVNNADGTDPNATLTEAMRILANGNIGIGTTTPYAKLTIEGSGIFDGAALELSNTGTGGRRWSMFSTNSQFSQGAGKFLLYNMTSATDAFVIDSNNWMGLGTNTPAQKFHLANSGTTYLHITNDTTGHTANDGLDIGFYSGENVVVFANREATDIAFSTGGSENFRIKYGGLLVGSSGYATAYAASTLANMASGLFCGSSQAVTQRFGFGVQGGFYYQGSYDSANQDFSVRTPTSDGSLGALVAYISPLGVIKGTSIKIGANWEAVPSGTSDVYLDLKYGGVLKARLDSSGNITAVGGVTAFAI